VDDDPGTLRAQIDTGAFASVNPDIRTTVIDERDLLRFAGNSPKDFRGDCIEKYNDAGNFTFHATHRRCTDQEATTNTSSALARSEDPDFEPRFKHEHPVLDECPTCIQAKQTKEPAGHNTTPTATVPYQGLSVDFSFAGVKSSIPDQSMPPTDFSKLTQTDGLPDFPDVPRHVLAGFIDAAHAADLRNRCSTTGYASMLAGGVVFYRSKTQTITATSSTEAKFLAAVLAAKHAKYLRAVLLELGFSQRAPTPLYEDKMSAINIINARVPTERSRHIDIQHFALQDWQDRGDIIMRHIPGILNPGDDLTKPLGWVLHGRHARRIMGYYG
jgi:hypothetical protein